MRPNATAIIGFMALTIAAGQPAVAQDADAATTPFVETVTTRVDGPVDTGLPVERLNELELQFAAGKIDEARTWPRRSSTRRKVAIQRPTITTRTISPSYGPRSTLRASSSSGG